MTSGYAPLLARVLQALLQATAPMEDVAKAVGFEYFREDRARRERAGGVDVVVAVGGLTYMEVAAIRLLRSMVEGERLVMMTTEMIESFALLRKMVEEVVGKKEEEEEEKKKSWSVCCSKGKQICLLSGGRCPTRRF